MSGIYYKILLSFDTYAQANPSFDTEPLRNSAGEILPALWSWYPGQPWMQDAAWATVTQAVPTDGHPNLGTADFCSFDGTCWLITSIETLVYNWEVAAELTEEEFALIDEPTVGELQSWQRTDWQGFSYYYEQPTYRWYFVDYPDYLEFTHSSDEINFNAVALYGINWRGSPYSASSGNDNVVLPSDENREKVQTESGEKVFSSSVIEFFAGAGNDTVDASFVEESFVILWGGADNDTLIGSSGDDILRGGTGDDSIDGGDGDDEFLGGKGEDTLIGGDFTTDGDTDDFDSYLMEGARSDYRFKDFSGTRTEWYNDKTGETDVVEGFEKVSFKKDFAGPNIIDFNLVLELAKAQLAAYGIDFLPGQDWRPIHANSLGLPSVSDEAADHQYVFKNGVYEDYDGVAVAHVGEAMVAGEHSVILSFRGTDSFPSDPISGWGPQVLTDHWPRFQPLIEGLKVYLADADIEQIYVTGHSLGGIIAQLFMEEIRDYSEARAITFGSPGAPSSATSVDSRVLHIEHSEDIVAVSSNAQLDAFGYEIAFTKSGEQLQIPLDDLTTSNDDGIDNFEGLSPYEHSSVRYLESTEALIAVNHPSLSKAIYDVGQSSYARAGTDGNDIFGGDNGTAFVGSIPNPLYYSDEELWGRKGNDVIMGRAGNDTIWGGGGDDKLYGDAGKALSLGTLPSFVGTDHDYVSGGWGKDVIAGARGRDTLIGDGGADTIYGGSGRDELYGGAGRDVLYGGDGKDTLRGGSENDYFVGGARNDVIYGDAGLDTVEYFLDVAQYSVIKTGSKGWQISHLASGDTDQLWNIETVIFNDDVLFA